MGLTETMFNIVKRRDFMLGQQVPTRQQAEKSRDDYGKEYVVVQTVPLERLDAKDVDFSDRDVAGKL